MINRTALASSAPETLLVSRLPSDCRRLVQATLMATPVAVAERELREYLDVAVTAARHAGEVRRIAPCVCAYPVCAYPVCAYPVCACTMPHSA
ncbi:unnamed protein product [Closterium sp. NIES-53]